MTTNPYQAAVRRIEARAELDYYTGGDDKNSGIYLDGVNIGVSDPRAYQLITEGLVPLHKYATLDGHTTLNGDCRVYGEGVFPIWASNSMSGVQDAGGYAFLDSSGYRLPVYRVEFAAVRELSAITVIGDEKWAQGPTAMQLKLTLENGETQTHEYTAPEEYVTQTLKFDYCYCKSMELTLTHWSAPHAAARLMYFGASENVMIGSDGIESLTVLEEKTSADRLAYGVTSGVCTLRLKNEGNRFLINPDFLKRSRKVQPSIACTLNNERRNAEDDEYEPLGTYFSDAWDVDASSQYLKCEAYDILYGLQSLNLCYRMERQADGYYVMDGTDSYGTTPTNQTGGDGCPVRVNTIGGVFRKIFWLINKKRTDSGIFDMPLDYSIDPRLNSIPIACVLLGRETAWNMLSSAAAFALAFVYTDRSGRVCVTRDRFSGENGAPEPSGVSINPSNSYAFNLPALNRFCVNTVKASYSEVNIPPKEEPSEYRFTVPANTEPILGQYAAELKFDKSFKKYKVEIDVSTDIGYIEASYDALGFVLLKQNSVPVGLKMNAEHNSFTVKSASREFADSVSQRRYGTNAYDYKAALATTAVEAETRAQLILSRYANGFSYMDATWRGDMRAELGSTVEGYTRIASEGVNLTTEIGEYEVMSREITVENGLREKLKGLETRG